MLNCIFKPKKYNLFIDNINYKYETRGMGNEY
jgi:hypothetical protein